MEDMDNSATQGQDNSPAQPVVSAPAATGWKTSLSADYKNSPLVQKFEDTPDGLNKAIESHLNLEQLLGHEKVPIPKSADDVEGWNRFSKALGIPDKAEGYGLADAKFPDTMKGLTIDKNKFAEIVHAHKLTPDQAKGLWSAYNEINIDAYGKAMEEHQKSLGETINALKGQWGDAYDTNVELGQVVINKFTENQEDNDMVTALLSQNPVGIKFLAKIGEQFAENKMGDFQIKKFSLAPEEAQAEIEKLTMDLEGPYMNVNNKFGDKEHQAAMDRVNHLYAVVNKGRG